MCASLCTRWAHPRTHVLSQGPLHAALHRVWDRDGGVESSPSLDACGEADYLHGLQLLESPTRGGGTGGAQSRKIEGLLQVHVGSCHCFYVTILMGFVI